MFPEIIFFILLAGVLIFILVYLPMRNKPVAIENLVPCFTEDECREVHSYHYKTNSVGFTYCPICFTIINP